jgi:hypothetical protein
MSNTRPLKARRITLQHELDHIHGFAPDDCSCGSGTRRMYLIDCSEGLTQTIGEAVGQPVEPVLEGWRRVAAATLRQVARSSSDKQETPEAPTSRASTDLNPQRQDLGGCSPKFAR